METKLIVVTIIALIWIIIVLKFTKKVARVIFLVLIFAVLTNSVASTAVIKKVAVGTFNQVTSSKAVESLKDEIKDADKYVRLNKKKGSLEVKIKDKWVNVTQMTIEKKLNGAIYVDTGSGKEKVKDNKTKKVLDSIINTYK